VTSRPLVAVLDYDAGNLRSAAKALGRAGADVTVTRDAVEAAGSDALVVPGVGHFGQCVRRFREVGLESLVRDWVEADLPLLGVCIGMQILYRASEEDPQTPGLGILPGVVRERCYFVHSYYAQPDDPAHVLATTDYGPGFPSVVRIGATLGTQFHPEKSSAVGGRLLANFVKEAARPRAPA
jgi:imidazole glycerol-phosphate synthase subunit HisH